MSGFDYFLDTLNAIEEAKRERFSRTHPETAKLLKLCIESGYVKQFGGAR